MPEPDDSNELQQRYQEILNQYADALSKQPDTLPTPQPPPPVADPMAPPPPSLPDEVPVKTGLFFKILFYFSLVIFFSVTAAIIFNFISHQQSTNTTPDTTSPTPTTDSGLTPAEVPVCELNDATYHIGDTFPATDGCNSCACQSDQLIVCTEKICTPATDTLLLHSVTPSTSSTQAF